MNRQELIGRYLCPSEIKIDENDYEFLSLFEEFKYILDTNEELYYGDLGNDYTTKWAIYTKKEEGYVSIRNTKSQILWNHIIKNKINELYPEPKIIKKNSKVIDGKLTFGKYKDKDIKWVIENDKSYYDWCKINIKGFTQ